MKALILILFVQVLVFDQGFSESDFITRIQKISMASEIQQTRATTITKGHRLRGDYVIESVSIPKNLELKTPMVRTVYTIPHNMFFYRRKLITYIEVQITSENAHVDVDIFGGGIGRTYVCLVVTGYNTKIFHSKVTVYGIKN